MKDVAEERLFARRRDLLTRLDLVFMDAARRWAGTASARTIDRICGR